MEALGKARKWGNSLGIVLPNEFVKSENIEEGDEVVVQKKKPDITALRGILKGAKMTSQEFKDKARKTWEE